MLSPDKCGDNTLRPGGPGGRVTHMGVITRLATRTTLQRVLTTCVKCVVSIELRCLCINIKVPIVTFSKYQAS